MVTLMAFVAGGFGVLGWLLIGLFYGWALFAYLHYRNGRQEELWQVLSAAVETQAPLPQALRAYLRDRPRGLGRKVWSAVLLFFIFPGYYWIWHIWNNFDRKVRRLSFLLEEGLALSEALELTPGVAKRETILAAAVGEETGQTALCLKQAARRLPTTAWIELVPRLLYPLALMLYLTAALSFWMTVILPKMQKIYRDFNCQLPWLTREVASTGPVVVLGLWLFTILQILLVVLQLVSSTVRWYFPVLGWAYRRDWQGRVLRLLSVLLETGRPVLSSVELLRNAGAVPPTVARRLEAVGEDLEQGQPLGPSLHKQGLLPTALLPLVQSAERSQNLPRVLGELGEHLSQQPIRFLRRLSQMVALVLVVLMGGLVALVATSMFLPLVGIMEALSE
jgi:type II secretory pathway component PulF